MSKIKSSPKPESCTKLDALRTFLGALQLPGTEASVMMGLSVATLNHAMRGDNMKLSMIEDLFASLAESEQYGKNPYVFRINLVLPEVKKELDIFDFIKNGKPKRLFFLWNAIYGAGYTKTNFAEASGIDYQRIRYWTLTDDIYTDDIYRVAEFLKAKLEIIIEPKKEPAQIKGASVDFTVTVRKTCKLK